MRINKFVAQASGLSRRAADTAIIEGRVLIDGEQAQTGQDISNQRVTLDGKPLHLDGEHQTIILNKPVGYVVSRNGQGSRTIYDLLPPKLYSLKPVGRLDKDSSGLLLLTNDGNLAHELTHPRFAKPKVYEVRLNKPLTPFHRQIITDHGIEIEDGTSKFFIERLHDGNDLDWKILMHEGRNRQIRRTFEALGYTVTRLHRIQFGNYRLDQLMAGEYRAL